MFFFSYEPGKALIRKWLKYFGIHEKFTFVLDVVKSDMKQLKLPAHEKDSKHNLNVVLPETFV
jgi:hypothetical protein